MKNLLIIFLFASLQLDAQNFFQRTYGGTGSEFGRGVVQTSDGGYACVGATNSYGDGSSNVYLIKVDDLGNYLWGRNLGGSGTIEWGMDIVEDSEGNLIIAGHTNETQNGDYNGLAIKLTAEGETIWYRTFGADDWDFFETLDIDEENSIYLVGNTFRDNKQKGWILKITSEGEEVWEEVLDGSGSIYITGISICNNENIGFVGFSENQLNQNKNFLSGSIDSLGNLSWVSAKPQWGNISTGKCDCNENGRLVSVGTFDDDNDLDPYLVIQDIEFGELLVNILIENPLNQSAFGVNYLVDGTIAIVGWGDFIYFEGIDGIGFVRGENGEYTSEDLVTGFGSVESDIMYDCFKSNDGGYIAVGESNSYGNNYQLLLAKVAPNGDTTQENVDFTDLPTNTTIRENGGLEIYPNPTTGTISLKSERPIYSISICNAQGEILRNIEMQKINPERIDLSGLENGLYILRLDYPNGSASTHKVIKH